MKAMIRYWTGTGNTARTVGLLAGVLVEAGWSVDSAEVRWDSPVPSPETLAGSDLLLLASPTLGFSTPEHFLRWVRRLPGGSGGKAAILGVCGAVLSRRGLVPGHPGVLLVQLDRILRRRGFTVVSRFAASYPENWTQMVEPPGPEVSKTMRALTDPGVLSWARDLADGTSRTAGEPRYSAVKVVLSAVAALFRLVGRRFLGKLYAADPSCTACGLCARTCPAGAILMKGDRPAWGLDCDACNRCINLCPSASIQVTLARVVVHGAGNLALTLVSILLIGPWGFPEALFLFLLGTILELTLVDGILGRLERIPYLARTLTWGWTKGWRRYRAPGFHPLTP